MRKEYKKPTIDVVLIQVQQALLLTVSETPTDAQWAREYDFGTNPFDVGSNGYD